MSGAGGAVADGGLAGTVDAAQDDDGDEMVVAEDEGHAKACGGGGGGGGGEDVGDGHQGGQGLQALVLCPTRELALQVAAHLREVVGGTGLAVVVRDVLPCVCVVSERVCRCIFCICFWSYCRDGGCVS